jgi:hypothetical protein
MKDEEIYLSHSDMIRFAMGSRLKVLADRLKRMPTREMKELWEKEQTEKDVAEMKGDCDGCCGGCQQA